MRIFFTIFMCVAWFIFGYMVQLTATPTVISADRITWIKSDGLYSQKQGIVIRYNWNMWFGVCYTREVLLNIDSWVDFANHIKIYDYKKGIYICTKEVSGVKNEKIEEEEL